MQQALRISDKVAFMYLGEVIEYDTSSNIFNNPKNELTRRYVGGQFG
jgi:phosphate transport system ATP-binding protein